MNNQLTIKRNNSLTEFVFFGNYFYGLCAVALSIEATLQQRFPLDSPGYFVLVFLATVLYYTHPYVRKCSYISSNPRTNWYTRNYTLVRWSQSTITAILIAALTWFLWDHGNTLLNMPAKQWLLIFIFPFVAALYYGINSLSGKYNLRKIGWLKPFIIGFTWAGLVTVYPVLYYDIINDRSYQFNWIGGLLFIKNLMFVAVLCIMFDVKDYSTDYINRLKTFVVGMGLRKTIFYILLPLTILGLLSFIYYAQSHHFNQIKVLLNTIPFILLIVAAFSLRKRRPLLYYLIVIDGLMLVKAICGSIAMTWF
jgi:hypothetical protein